MDEYIKKSAALEALGERPIIWSDNDEYTLGERNQYDMDRLAIETVPSAQPEIIHCKDCVHHIDGFFCRQANHHTSDKDHCASVFRAERRTDE